MLRESKISTIDYNLDIKLLFEVVWLLKSLINKEYLLSFSWLSLPQVITVGTDFSPNILQTLVYKIFVSYSLVSLLDILFWHSTYSWYFCYYLHFCHFDTIMDIIVFISIITCYHTIKTLIKCLQMLSNPTTHQHLHVIADNNQSLS